MKEKMAFISCVNDEEEYSKSVKYIEELYVPENIEVEIIPIRNAKSICSGYNLGMNKTTAKYKVYLHQDAFIINKNFIVDVVSILRNDRIGLIGVIGAKYLPINGIWWESKERCGMIYENRIGTIRLLKFTNPINNYEKVNSVDGVIIITQKDLKWREDIFDGWHFYDISQCMEFNRSKLEIVVPRQNEPWVLHDCGVTEMTIEYELYRQKFLEEYALDMFRLKR